MKRARVKARWKPHDLQYNERHLGHIPCRKITVMPIATSHGTK